MIERSDERLHFESVWVVAIGRALNHGQLEDAVNGAIRARAYGPAARQAYVDRLNYLATEEAVRLDERIKVLRDVRNAVAKADAAVPFSQAYDWGYGASDVRKYLTWKLAEARREAGIEDPLKGTVW